MAEYKVKFEVFEGPLDLLLYLIKKEEVDIYDIPIERITNQYMEYLSLMQLRAARARSPWLMLAASDAAALPFRNGAYDVVHWSWLLEHVPPSRAVDILREVRRALSPEGHAWMTEVDNDSLAFWPRIP